MIVDKLLTRRRPIYVFGGILAVVLLAGSMLLGSAAAAQAECLPDEVSEGFSIVPIEGETRSEVQEQARNTWDDWIWRGDEYVCNDRAIDCEYKWSQVKTTTTYLTIGVALNLGNNNSPAGKWWNYAQSILPSFGKTKEVTTKFDRTVVLKPGQTARPIQIATRRWRRGTYRGGYFKLDTDQTCAEGGTTGHWYWKSTERTWGSWSDNVMVESGATYLVDGKSPNSSAEPVRPAAIPINSRELTVQGSLAMTWWGSRFRNAGSDCLRLLGRGESNPRGDRRDGRMSPCSPIRPDLRRRRALVPRQVT